MAHALTIACGVVLVALLAGCYLSRGRDSAVARAGRRALLFVAPLSLAALLFSLHGEWLLATTDVVRSGATIGEIEAAMDRVRLPSFLHAVLQGTVPAVPLTALLVLAVLPFVRPGIFHPRHGKPRRTSCDRPVRVRHVAAGKPSPGQRRGADARCGTGAPAGARRRRGAEGGYVQGGNRRRGAGDRQGRAARGPRRCRHSGTG